MAKYLKRCILFSFLYVFVGAGSLFLSIGWILAFFPPGTGAKFLQMLIIAFISSFICSMFVSFLYSKFPNIFNSSFLWWAFSFVGSILLLLLQLLFFVS
jgi:hypothetical protein